LSVATVWRHRQSDPEFAAAFEESLRTGALILEEEAFRRAKDGLVRKKFTKSGQPIIDPETSEEILGRRARDLIGSRFCDLHSPADRERVEDALRQVQVGLHRADVTASCIRKDETLAAIVWSLQSSLHYHRIFCVGRERLPLQSY